MRGERRSTRRGASVEFRDFRKYEAGDDFRHVDWSIFARLERLMLRQFVEEEDVRIDILIDQSQSMHFGKPVTKFDFARRAAAALAFLAVGSLDRVSVATFDSELRSRTRALRGRGHLHSILAFLEGLDHQMTHSDEPEGTPDNNQDQNGTGDETERSGDTTPSTNIGSVIRKYQRATLKTGIVFMISDFLDENNFRTEMKLLAQRGFDLNLIQVMMPEELEPTLKGDLTLVDSESGTVRDVSLNERLIASYKQTLGEYTKSLELFCRGAGIGYTITRVDVSFEDLLLRELVRVRMAE
jgi:uncharacterized protein (DUF58 family)